MIEHKGQKYYTIYELMDFINNEDSDLGKAWMRRFPSAKRVILTDQIRRILTDARLKKRIKFLEYKKNSASARTYYAYTEEDVRSYVANLNEYCNVIFHNKEK